MDPQAALDRAQSALDAGDLDEAQDALADYHKWRTRGGFEPPGGDERHRKLTIDLEHAQEDEQPICQACRGSGEGMADGQPCSFCRGKGERP